MSTPSDQIPLSTETSNGTHWHQVTLDSAGPLQISRLERDKPLHPELFARLLTRLRAFSQQMGIQASPQVEETLWQHFAQNTGYHSYWVAHRNLDISAHLHAEIKDWNGEWVAWIGQAKIDHPKEFTHDRTDHVLQDVEAWMRRMNDQFPHLKLNKMIFASYRDAKVWQKRFGFSVYATLLQRRIL